MAARAVFLIGGYTVFAAVGVFGDYFANHNASSGQTSWRGLAAARPASATAESSGVIPLQKSTPPSGVLRIAD
jgi:hypothetical protein